MTPTRIVIDTDMGVDDALAVVLAANSPEVEVAALTTVAGNAEVRECTRNSLLLAAALWPTPRPRATPDARITSGPRLSRTSPLVAEGAATPLDVPLTTAPEVHGADGLGGDLGSLPRPTRASTDTPAHELLIELAEDDPGDIVLVATGPLTNLALAHRARPGVLTLFRRIVVMGGALDVPGNTGPHAEFNFYVDPAAADVILNLGLDVTVVPLDATTMVRIPRTALETLPRWKGALAASGALGTDRGEPPSGGVTQGNGEPGQPSRERVDLVSAALARALDYYIRFQHGESALDAGYMHDPVALAAAFAPDLLGTREIPLRVIRDGPQRGRSVEADDGRPAVRVAVNADRTSLEHLLFERVLKPLFG